MDNSSTWPLVEILNGLPKHLRLKQFGSGIPLVGQRQQWNFSPQDPTGEAEDHQAELSAVTVLELSIIPDISGGNAFASLAQMRLAYPRTQPNYPATLFQKDRGSSLAPNIL